jgi:hypothetical protein
MTKDMKDKRQDIEAELSDIAPSLSKLKEGDAFAKMTDIPDDYFDNLSIQIFEKTILTADNSTQAAKESYQPRSTTIWTTVRQYLQSSSIVGALGTVVLIIIGIAFLQPTETESQEVAADLTQEEIEEFITNNIDIFEEEQLSQYVSTTLDIETTTTIDDIETETLEDYIEDNFIDDLTIDELL